jgi:hypothetical protein
MGGNDDAISLPHVLNGGADFYHDAKGFVADDSTFEAAHTAFVEMEVRAADGSGGDAQQDIGSLLYLRIRYLTH